MYYYSKRKTHYAYSEINNVCFFFLSLHLFIYSSVYIV